MLHPDRKHLLDGRAKITAHAETVFAADHEETAAELLDPGAVKLHLVARHAQGRDVAEHEQIEALQLAQGARQAGRAAHLDIDLRVAQGVGQGGGARFV